MPKINIFDTTLATSKRGNPLVPGLRKFLVSGKANVRCVLRSKFDGMIDGSRTVNEEVPTSWVVDQMLDSDRSTRFIYVSNEESVPFITISDACYTVDIYGAEAMRRQDMVKELPAIPVGGTGIKIPQRDWDGHIVHREIYNYEVERARNQYLSVTDPMEFDERFEQVRACTEVTGLYAFLQARSLIHSTSLEETDGSTGRDTHA